MRKIFFDTETTGFYHKSGDRVIQIGLVEMIDEKITNQKEYFLNPEGRKSNRDAFVTHGIKDSFLLDKPTFREIADEFLSWIKGAELYAHNAQFDINMINNELSLIGKSERIDEFCKVIDTISLARKNLPITKYSLDAVQKHLKIDESKRGYHSALEDSVILAKVYLAMFKKDNSLFDANPENKDKKELNFNDIQTDLIQKIKIKLSLVNEQEEDSHRNFFEIADMKTKRI